MLSFAQALQTCGFPACFTILDLSLALRLAHVMPRSWVLPHSHFKITNLRLFTATSDDPSSGPSAEIALSNSLICGATGFSNFLDSAILERDR
jgi:hypothetical protein